MKEKIQILLTVEIEYSEKKYRQRALKYAKEMAQSGSVSGFTCSTRPIKSKIIKNFENLNLLPPFKND